MKKAVFHLWASSCYHVWLCEIKGEYIFQAILINYVLSLLFHSARLLVVYWKILVVEIAQVVQITQNKPKKTSSPLPKKKESTIIGKLWVLKFSLMSNLGSYFAHSSEILISMLLLRYLMDRMKIFHYGIKERRKAGEQAKEEIKGTIFRWDQKN